jgi:hypothetical protein
MGSEYLVSFEIHRLALRVLHLVDKSSFPIQMLIDLLYLQISDHHRGVYNRNPYPRTT